MHFIVYEGDAANPLDQHMRLVEAADMAAAQAQAPHAIMVQRYEEPREQDRPPLRKLAAGMPVLSL